ncbi:MAG: beta-propeller fold lactonase family protein, partial [Verrucomicrobiota bacterium]
MRDWFLLGWLGRVGGGICFVFLTGVGVAEEVLFRAYLPSRETGELLVVEALEEGEGLELRMEERVELGFAGSTIVGHPEEAVLYVTGREGKGKAVLGAEVRLGEELELAVREVHCSYAFLKVDEGRRFLLGANYREGKVDVYALGEDGSWGERVFGLDEGRKTAHCVMTTRDNRFVYVPYVKGENALYQYAFDGERGRLRALEPKDAGPPEGTGPRHLVVHPRLPFLYASNEQGLGVSVYRIGEEGQLELEEVVEAVEEGR